jgi:hypothetical protein
MKSLWEIEEAIAKLPKESQQQLLRDIPALCPQAFPEDGWDAIITDPAPRPALTLLLNRLDSEHQKAPGKFLAVNEDNLREP